MANPLADSEESNDGMQVEGTLGQLDQHAIQTAITPQLGKASRCFQSRTRRQPYLGGEITLQFRITRDGAIKTLSITKSSIGSIHVERCVVASFSGISFNRPRGGEAEFSYSMSFKGRYAPVVWDPGMVKDELAKNTEKLLTIKEGGGVDTILTLPRGLVTTFYVNRRGKVLSVGMTAEEEIEEYFYQPFIKNLKKIRFEDPQSRYAKVTYQW